MKDTITCAKSGKVTVRVVNPCVGNDERTTLVLEDVSLFIGSVREAEVNIEASHKDPGQEPDDQGQNDHSDSKSSDDNHKDTMLILQLLRDNLTLWTSEIKTEKN